jgi:hypothetical protein
MKFILTIFAFTVFVKFSVAQKKGDNTIIVHGFVNYNKIKEALFDEGFVPINSDTSFISTNKKSFGSIAEFSYIIKKTDTTLIFKGFLSGSIMGYTFNNLPVNNTSGNDKAGFDMMNKIATSFRLPITYLRIKQ